MQEKVQFPAKLRSVLGKKVKTIRQGNNIPANITGHLDKPVAITIDRVAFSKLYQKSGDTGVVYIQVEGEKQARPVLINELQLDPVHGQTLHVVFRQVDLSEKVEAEVPVEIIGELSLKDGLIVTIHDAITVSALPQDLPEKFVIDLTKFTEFGQMVTFEQLDYDKSKITLVVPEEQLSTPVVMRSCGNPRSACRRCYDTSCWC